MKSGSRGWWCVGEEQQRRQQQQSWWSSRKEKLLGVCSCPALTKCETLAAVTECWSPYFSCAESFGSVGV